MVVHWIMKLRPGSLIPCALLSILCPAQDPVRLVDPTTVMDDISFGGSEHIVAGLQAAGLDDDMMMKVLRYSAPVKWPEAWRTDSARTANEHILVNTSAYQLCEVFMDDREHVVVWIPSLENLHMPENTRMSDDFFVLMPAHGVAAPPPAERPKASRGPNWKAMPKARIVEPQLVYATYDLARDETAINTLEAYGMSRPEIEAVIFRSHERNWPEGIDELEKRRTKLKHLKKYKAHVAAKWDDKVLVVIPAELNRKLPASMRPYMDIYMIYNQPAVAVMKK